MRGKNVGKFMRASGKCPPNDGKINTRVEGTPNRPIPGARGVLGQGAGAADWALVTPRKVASELSLLGLGEGMQPYVLNLIYRGTSAHLVSLPSLPR